MKYRTADGYKFKDFFKENGKLFFEYEGKRYVRECISLKDYYIGFRFKNEFFKIKSF